MGGRASGKRGSLQVCADIPGGGIDEGRCTRTLRTDDNFVPDVVGKNIVVLVERVDRGNVLVLEIRGPCGGKAVNGTIRREGEINAGAGSAQGME